MANMLDESGSSRSESFESDVGADIEKGAIVEEDGLKRQPEEYTTPFATKMAALGLWLCLNIALTLHNKAVLNAFYFPWILTVIHALCASFGTLALLVLGKIQLTSLSLKDNLILVAYSTLFTINIAMSNVSLSLVSVPFHQTVRSTSPVVALLAYRLVFGRRYATETCLSLIPIVLGVMLATQGEYEYTAMGLWTTLAGVVLAVAKTIMSNRLMTGHRKLSASEMLLRMSPLAALQGMGYAVAMGEVSKVQAWAATAATADVGWSLKLGLLGNGLVAFGVNISSLHTNRVAGAVALSVGGNLKQCLTMLLGAILFHVRVDHLNGAGMVLVLAGAAWYSKAELTQRTLDGPSRS